VPTAAVAATSNKLQMPSYDEGFDALYFVKNDGETMTVSDQMISTAFLSGKGGYSSSSVSEYQYATEEMSSCVGR